MSCLWSLIWSNRVWGSWYLIIWMEITVQSSAMNFVCGTLCLDSRFQTNAESVILVILQKYQSLSNQSFKYNLSIWPPSWFFQKCIIWREGETLLFVTFNIIISHTFPEKIIYENSSCRSENIKISLSIWAIFTFFHRFFRFFNISLLQRN